MTESDVEAFKASVLAKLALAVGKDGDSATARDWFVATALALRDRVVHRWLAVNRASRAEGKKNVYYLSLEFLIGRLLGEVSNNLELTDPFDAALGDLGVDVERMFSAEPDAALGNGGLGRLAACFMESMASLAIPAIGYGIRYDHGLFRQVIKDGGQQEYPENWLSFGNPWEFERPETIYDVGFGGLVEMIGRGQRARRLAPDETVQAVAYDTPVVGWKGRHVNPLRLWSARAVDPLRLDVFNAGDHVAALSRAGARRDDLENPLPERRTPSRAGIAAAAGVFFRLRLAAGSGATARANLRRHPLAPRQGGDPAQRHASGIAVAELMRVLIDVLRPPVGRGVEHHGRARSPTPTTRCCPKRWRPGRCDLSSAMLPRHLQIIYRINATHLEWCGRTGDDEPTSPHCR